MKSYYIKTAFEGWEIFVETSWRGKAAKLQTVCQWNNKVAQWKERIERQNEALQGTDGGFGVAGRSPRQRVIMWYLQVIIKIEWSLNK